MIKKIARSIIKYWSYIYPPALSNTIDFCLNHIYTSWIAREFKSIGNGAYIARPMYLRGGKYIEIGDNVRSLARLRLECWDQYEKYKYSPNMIIGNNVIFNYGCHIGCINKVVIGNNVVLASNIFITDHYHGYADERDLNTFPAKRELISKGPVIIENNVLIGEGVAIMPNVTIGINSIIGANSVVTKNIPKNSVVSGNPARIIKTL